MKKILLSIISAYLLFSVSAQPVSENFSDYPVGGKLAEEALLLGRHHWSTWDYDSVGTSQDGEIAELTAGNKCGKFIYGNNQILATQGLGGAFNLSFKIFVPTTKDAALNFYSAEDWWNRDSWSLVLQLAFATDLSDTPVYTPGTGKIYGGSPNFVTFNFQHDTWLNVRIFFNVESDICRIFLNDNLIHSYKLSLGPDGQGCPQKVSALSIFPSTSEELSTFYMDDFVTEKVAIKPSISVAPTSISEHVLLGSNLPISKPITITNSGGGVSDYNSWIEFDFEPQQGTQNFTITHLVEDPNLSTGPPAEFEIELGARFSGNQLCAQIGTYITKISYFLPAPAVVPSLTFRIYAPNNLLSTGEKLLEFTKNGPLLPYSWNEVTLPEPFLIDKTELWVAVQFLHSASYHCVSFEVGSSNPFTNYLREPGKEWIQLEGGNIALTATAQGAPIPGGCWCTTDGNIYGKVLGENSVTLNAIINPTELIQGTNSATVFINTTDSVNGPVFSVPVSLIVGNVGVETITNDELRITVYPNPTTGEIIVQEFKGSKVQKLEVFDVYGRICHVSPVTRHENKIDISHLLSGVYFLKITTETDIVTKKIIKH